MLFKWTTVLIALADVLCEINPVAEHRARIDSRKMLVHSRLDDVQSHRWITETVEEVALVELDIASVVFP
eukprot:COSAG02_NODE_4756_length_5022_cov_1.825107_1_plen_70_part_00